MNGSRPHRFVRSMNLWIGVGTVGSIGLAVLGTNIGAIPRPGDNRWWFHVPGGVSIPASLAFYTSVLLLIAGWAGVGFLARSGRLTIRRSWLILALWGLPLLVGPPIFSRDIYSYIGQGLLAHHGFNPYSVAPSALGNGPILASIASVWRNTASPYGPLFVMVTKLGVIIAGNSLVVQVIVFRLMELVGVAMMMVALPRLARRLGTDPGLALWLGVLSPLGLFSFIASGHNDALMVGLLLAGVALALEGRLALGMALCALATLIKLPAAVAIVVIAVEQFQTTRGTARRRVLLEAVVVPAVVIAGGTVAAGLGWTWLGPTALHVPTELRVLATPAVSLGAFVHSIVHAVGIPVSRGSTVTGTQLVCGLLAVAGSVWLVINARRLDVVRVIGLALMLVVLGSPTLWPWYLMWGLALLAATGAQRSWVLAAVAGLAMLVVGPGGSPMLNGWTYFVIAPLLLAAGAYLIRGRQWRTVVVGHAA